MALSRTTRTVIFAVLVIGLGFASSSQQLQGADIRPTLTPSPTEPTSSPENLYPRWWGKAPKLGAVTPCRDPGKCVVCHRQQAKMDASHALPCVKCHGGDPRSDDEEKAHQGLISDPGDLTRVPNTCGKCHPEEARRVTLSPMALAPRMINHTRFAFGAQKSPLPKFATVAEDGLAVLPQSSVSGSLGDDLLRRSCLRCHLYTRGSDRWGEHRGMGCSACHVPYPNSSDGEPRTHGLVRSVGVTACLKCHNANHVGADYVGLYEKDFERGFISPFVEGRQPSRIYGAEQHRLASDVHFRAGMECMDCHTLDEVHGSGTPPKAAVPNLTISCEGCHVRGDHPAVLREDNGDLLLLRGPGRKIPRWNPDLIPHRIAEHRAKLRCSACHAAWSFQDYGFHVMLEERPDYWKWAPTAAQNDPQVQEILNRYVGTYADAVPPKRGSRKPLPEEQWKPPTTRDWLSGEVRSGAWFRGYTARRWEDPPLGLDHTGKVSIMRPMRQYVVSHVDAQENLLLDRKVPTTGGGFSALIFNPYVPHTTSAEGRSCHECHGNPKAVGLGGGLTGIGKPGFKPLWEPEQKVPGLQFRWDALLKPDGEPVQFSTRPSSGPLDPSTIKRLMNPSKRHRAEWHRYLNRVGR